MYEGDEVEKLRKRERKVMEDEWTDLTLADLSQDGLGEGNVLNLNSFVEKKECIQDQGHRVPLGHIKFVEPDKDF